MRAVKGSQASPARLGEDEDKEEATAAVGLPRVARLKKGAVVKEVFDRRAQRGGALSPLQNRE